MSGGCAFGEWGTEAAGAFIGGFPKLRIAGSINAWRPPCDDVGVGDRRGLAGEVPGKGEGSKPSSVVWAVGVETDG